jgi:hypothetical protein
VQNHAPQQLHDLPSACRWAVRTTVHGSRLLPVSTSVKGVRRGSSSGMSGGSAVRRFGGSGATRRLAQSEALRFAESQCPQAAGWRRAKLCDSRSRNAHRPQAGAERSSAIRGVAMPTGRKPSLRASRSGLPWPSNLPFSQVSLCAASQLELLAEPYPVTCPAE